MATTSSPNNSANNGQATAIGTAVSITLAMVILLSICIAKTSRAMASLQERAPSSRVLNRRGLDVQVVNAIPVFKYIAKDGAAQSADEELGVLDRPVPTLQTIPEETLPRGGDNPSGQQAGTLGARVFNLLRAIIFRPPATHSTTKSLVAAEQARNCAICTEDFTNGASLRQLPCGHVYHLPCIDPWLENFAVTCPLCRIDISATTTVPPPLSKPVQVAFRI